ncbi:apolipoprotein M [Hoplias malabaricus]|uniref:apolipoprotein M n=1 Tax=Hoplias malabaricus TaxID=27720 RepID=UPI003461A443
MYDILLGIIYAAAKILVPCLPPAPLSSQGLLTNDKYMGKWYFIGVASWDEEDIAVYKPIDNSIAELHKGANDSVIMTAAINEAEECKIMSWTYKIDPDLDPLMEEGDRLGLAFDGKWVNCPSCLLLLKLDTENAFLRIMLFSRSQEGRAELVEKFKSRMECLLIFDQFVIPQQTKEFCKLDVIT